MGINFIKQFASLGLSKDVQLLTPGFSSDQDVIRPVGDALLGTFDAAHWALDLDNAANRKFVAAFEKEYNRLPTIYASFSRRELLVNLLEVRADSPPSPVVMITRMDRLSGLDVLHELWVRWEQWFAELEETHTSLPVLVFYRSQQNNHSWVNASGAMLDAAALIRSSVAIEKDVQADLMIRAGYLALRRIAEYFNIAFDPNPSPTAATSIDRGRYDEALSVLEAAGVPLVDDREQAWIDFNGWRVNYDTVLRGLERLTMAPTPWWERPMQSAYATDEPLVHEGVATVVG